MLSYLNLVDLNLILSLLYNSTTKIISSSIARQIGSTMATVTTELSSEPPVPSLVLATLTQDSNTLLVGAVHTS